VGEWRRLGTGAVRRGRVESSARIDPPKAQKGVKCERGCLPLHRGRGLEKGLCILSRNFFDFELKKVSFGAF